MSFDHNGQSIVMLNHDIDQNHDENHDAIINQLDPQMKHFFRLVLP